MNRYDLSYFDPGTGNPKRWNVALLAAQQAFAAEPFILEVGDVFELTEAVALSAMGWKACGRVEV